MELWFQALELRQRSLGMHAEALSMHGVRCWMWSWSGSLEWHLLYQHQLHFCHSSYASPDSCPKVVQARRIPATALDTWR